MSRELRPPEELGRLDELAEAAAIWLSGAITGGKLHSLNYAN
jgi:hypothetical protein